MRAERINLVGYIYMNLFGVHADTSEQDPSIRFLGTNLQVEITIIILTYISPVVVSENMIGVAMYELVSYKLLPYVHEDLTSFEGHSRTR